MNSEPELIDQVGETLTCAACGTVFDAAGQVVRPSVMTPRSALNP
jgi:hypothetical protein